MKNKKMKIISCTLAAIGLSILTIGIATTSLNKTSQFSTINSNQISLLSNSSNNFYYKYDNQIFYTMDELLRHYIKKTNCVKYNYYIGDFIDAINNYETKTIDINKLKVYNKDNIRPAYKNALGEYDYNYERVKKTYINRGLLSYKYDDFNGNLFNTYEEAKESILNSKNATPVMYYDVFNNKFNPLSKNDLTLFKQEVAQRIKANFLWHDVSSELALKIYDKDYIDGSKTYYSSQNSELLNNDRLIENIIDQVFVELHEIKYNLLKQQELLFDVQLELVNHGEQGRIDYEIQNFWKTNDNTSYNVTLSENKKQLLFKDIEFDKLDEFNIFLEKDKFYNSANVDAWIKKWALNKLAREAGIRNFFGYRFDVIFTGYDCGSSPGVDIDILDAGTEPYTKTGLTFDLKLSMKTKDGSDIKQVFKKAVNEYYLQKFESTSKESFYYQIYNQVMNDVFESLFKWNVLDSQLNYENANFGANNQKYTKITSSDVTELSNNELIFNKKISSEIFKYNDKKIVGLIYGYIIQNEDLLINTINSNNLSLVIEYNNSPLFKIPFKLNLDNYNLAKGIKDFILNIDEKELANSFENISVNFTKQKNAKNKTVNVLANNNENKIVTMSNNEWMFNYDINNEIYNELQNPNLDNHNEIDGYTINSIVKVYNKLLNSIKNTANYQEQLNKYFNKPEDIVFLYNDNETISPKSLKYREFLSNGLNTNLSVYDNSATKLYDDKDMLKTAIANNTILNPAKVVILYDLKGNVINPGVKLTDDERLHTTSDAIYDSENTLIQNLLRTKVIRPDLNYVYYYEPVNDSYTLLKNKTDLVYSLTFDNKKMYFLTHKDAMNYLRNYLDRVAIKVVY